MTPRPGIRVLAAATALALLVVACREITAPDGSQQFSGASKSLLNASGIVVVYPDSMRGWVFYNDQANAVCPTGSACRMVQGPATPPLGAGSAELYDSLTSDGKALILADYAGTRFDQITDLSYSTYRQTANTGNNLAISLQFNVDYDLGDAATGYQGRLVFEPYVGIGGNVPQNTWQTWDAKAGKWWGTRSTVTRNGASVANPCVQATPCTWAQALASFPNVGVHTLYGAVVLKAGSGWPGFRGNVDKLTIGVGGVATSFDFEFSAPSSVPASAPPSLPWDRLTADHVLWSPAALGYPVFADLVQVRFVAGTPLAERAAAVATVGGQVVGGYDLGLQEGYYVLQLPPDSSGALIGNAVSALHARSSVAGARPVLALANVLAYHRYNEGLGLGQFDWVLNPDSAFSGPAAPWAASAVGAPFAWGCSSGVGVTVAVVDMGLAMNLDLQGRTNARSDMTQPEATDILTHGQSVAGVLGASAGNGIGIAGIAHHSDLLLLDVAGRLTTLDSAGRRQPTDRIEVVDGRGIASDISMTKAWKTARDVHARVVNFSLGGETAPNASLADFYDKIAYDMQQVLENDTTFWNPLIVVAAGNAGPPGRHDWSPVGRLRDRMPTRTLVVGGAAKQKNVRWPLTSSGGTVDIYAPGDLIALYTSHQPNRWFWSGTSFASPLVAGAAALLFSFNPHLTAADVRSLLLVSASTSRHIGTVNFLDAYAALRLAATKRGAPICGNRVWRSADSIFVQRDTLIEALGAGSVTSPTARDLVLFHGGKHIEFDNQSSLNWDEQGLWRVGTASASTETPTGFYWSTKGYDHDGLGSSWTIVSNGTVESYWYDADYNELRSVSAALPPLPAAALTRPCSWNIWRDAPSTPDSTGSYPRYECGSTGYSGVLQRYEEGNSGGAMSPDGRFTLLAVNTLENTYTMPDWAPCSPGSYYATVGNPTSENPNLCRSFQLSTQPLSAFVVIADSASGAVRVASGISATGRNIDWLGVSEDGSELVMQSSRCVRDAGSPSQSCTDGRVDWRALSLPNAEVTSTPFSRPVTPILYTSRVTGAALREAADDILVTGSRLAERARQARMTAEPAVRKRIRTHRWGQFPR